jgi:hypothetical protein
MKQEEGRHLPSKNPITVVKQWYEAARGLQPCVEGQGHQCHGCGQPHGGD